ncbi:MAG: tetratricopeptide repeat protein, partial [Thermoanaerobaculia bacterium]
LALEYFHASLRLRQELGDSRAIANSFNNLGLVFRLRDDLSRAAECYKKSIDIFARIDDQYGMAAGMSNLADVLEMEGRYNEALEYAFRSLEKRKRFNSKSGVAFSYYRIAKIYLSKGDLDKAMAFAEKSLALRGEIGERMGTAYSQLQIAELYLHSGRLFEAFQQCGRGEREFEKIQNDLGRMAAREILARILIQMGVLDDAESLLEDTLDQARCGNQQIIVGACLLWLGRIALEKGRTGDAEAHLSRAEALFRENTNRREHAETLFERCVLALEEGEPGRASELLEEGYSILEALGIRDLVPRYFLLRGRIESEAPGGSPERARKFLERGLVEAREVHLPDLSWQLHFRLGLHLAGHGEPAVARGHLCEAQAILAAQYEPLPERFREGFWNTRERAKLRKLALEIAPGQAAAKEGAPPGAEATPAPSDGQIQEIRALNRKLLSLHEVGQAIISELDLDRLLEKLMDAVLELVDAERGFLI